MRPDFFAALKESIARVRDRNDPAEVEALNKLIDRLPPSCPEGLELRVLTGRRASCEGCGGFTDHVHGLCDLCLRRNVSLVANKVPGRRPIMNGAHLFNLYSGLCPGGKAIRKRAELIEEFEARSLTEDLNIEGWWFLDTIFEDRWGLGEDGEWQLDDDEMIAVDNLGNVWDALETPVYRVYANGEWNHQARVRALGEGVWLYLDTQAGFYILGRDDVAGWTMVEEEEGEEDEEPQEPEHSLSSLLGDGGF